MASCRGCRLFVAKYGSRRLTTRLNSTLPGHHSRIGSSKGKRMTIDVDFRQRGGTCIQSPFEGWLIDEVLANTLAFVNVKRDPSLGIISAFSWRALDAVKVTICSSATCCSLSVPCPRWDALSGDSHAASQPFRWPPMTENSPTWVDLKIKCEQGSRRGFEKNQKKPL